MCGGGEMGGREVNSISLIPRGFFWKECCVLIAPIHCPYRILSVVFKAAFLSASFVVFVRVPHAGVLSLALFLANSSRF